MTKYALLKYKTSNIGDYIQSLAAAQFLPSIDFLVNRDWLSSLKENVKIIFNGWFLHDIGGGRTNFSPEVTHYLTDWPPPPNYDPLFISFHLSSNQKLLSNDSISYFKNHGSIGCRDLHSVETLQKYKVDSYLSTYISHLEK